MTAGIRPIFLHQLEVRPLIDGRRTQLRRIIKPQPKQQRDGLWKWDYMLWAPSKASPEEPIKWCPFGKVGDKLWCRETWYPSFKRTKTSNGCVYKADDDGIHLNPGWSPADGWKSPAVMSRWASRLTLVIDSVRVEQIRSVSEDDAYASGADTESTQLSPFIEFRDQWDKMNGTGSWDKNPWVWALNVKVASNA